MSFLRLALRLSIRRSTFSRVISCRQNKPVEIHKGALPLMRLSLCKFAMLIKTTAYKKSVTEYRDV